MPFGLWVTKRREKVILLLSHKYKNVYGKTQGARSSSFLLAAVDEGKKKEKWKQDFTL